MEWSFAAAAESEESNARKRGQRRNFAVPWRLEVHGGTLIIYQCRWHRGLTVAGTDLRPAPTRAERLLSMPSLLPAGFANNNSIAAMSSSSQSSESPMLPIQFYIYIRMLYILLCNSPRARILCQICDTRRLIRRQQSEIPNSSLTPGAPPACESSCFCAAHYCFAVAHNFPRGAPASERTRIRIVLREIMVIQCERA
jgi:hypothetical protein